MNISYAQRETEEERGKDFTYFLFPVLSAIVHKFLPLTFLNWSQVKHKTIPASSKHQELVCYLLQKSNVLFSHIKLAQDFPYILSFSWTIRVVFPSWSFCSADTFVHLSVSYLNESMRGHVGGWVWVRNWTRWPIVSIWFHECTGQDSFPLSCWKAPQWLFPLPFSLHCISADALFTFTFSSVVKEKISHACLPNCVC